MWRQCARGATIKGGALVTCLLPGAFQPAAQGRDVIVVCGWQLVELVERHVIGGGVMQAREKPGGLRDGDAARR